MGVDERALDIGMAEKLPDNLQIDPVRDAYRRKMMPEIMKPQAGNACLDADCFPFPIDVRSAAVMAPGWKDIGSRDLIPSFLQQCLRWGVEPDRAWPFLGVIQHRAMADDTIPFQSENLLPPCPREQQQANGVARIG